jgi:hypothetical protein
LEAGGLLSRRLFIHGRSPRAGRHFGKNRRKTIFTIRTSGLCTDFGWSEPATPKIIPMPEARINQRILCCHKSRAGTAWKTE